MRENAGTLLERICDRVAMPPGGDLKRKRDGAAGAALRQLEHPD